MWMQLPSRGGALEVEMVSVSYVVASATSVDIWTSVLASEIDSVQNSCLRDHGASSLESEIWAGPQECRSPQGGRQMDDSFLEKV